MSGDEMQHGVDMHDAEVDQAAKEAHYDAVTARHVEEIRAGKNLRPRTVDWTRDRDIRVEQLNQQITELIFERDALIAKGRANPRTEPGDTRSGEDPRTVQTEVDHPLRPGTEQDFGWPATA